MASTPLSELNGRITALQFKLVEKGLDGALFGQKLGLFYFAGTTQNAYLYVSVEGDPLLMVQNDLDCASRESSLLNAGQLSSIKHIPDFLKEH